MLDIFKRLAGASRPATSTELREALRAIDEATLSAAVKTAADARDEALLAGDEKRLEKNEAALSIARRDLDRGRAAREALTTRLSETEQRERREEIEAERADIEAFANSVAADLKRIYPRASKEIIDALERLEEAEKRVKKFNEKAVHNDDYGPFIDAVDPRAFPMPNTIIWRGVAARTSLQPCKGSPGWGEARVILETCGVRF